jgi:hypothetical protein
MRKLSIFAFVFVCPDTSGEIISRLNKNSNDHNLILLFIDVQILGCSANPIFQTLVQKTISYHVFNPPLHVISCGKVSQQMFTKLKVICLKFYYVKEMQNTIIFKKWYQLATITPLRTCQTNRPGGVHETKHFFHSKKAPVHFCAGGKKKFLFSNYVLTFG